MFDENRRVYPKQTLQKGQIWPSGRPIWREHWRPMQVIGETRVSWLVGFENSTLVQHKLPKTAVKDGACPRDWALSEAHLDDLEWAEENRARLVEAVSRCRDARVLRAVDELLSERKKR